jgi:mono/diheme cytochrome c family protein
VIKALDRVLAPVMWLAAALAVVALAIGPEVIGAKDDHPSTAYPGTKPAAPDGPAIFADSCGGCHTLSAAQSTGSVGPNLDELAPDAATVTATVNAGAGSMPSFSGKLSDAQIAAVAKYVSENAGN